MKNKFNLMTSKEWLPFQKSWEKFDTTDSLYLRNLKFFTKSDELKQKVLYFGDNEDLFFKLSREIGVEPDNLENFKGESQFIFLDLRTFIDNIKSIDEYEDLKKKVFNMLSNQFDGLLDRRFVCILIQNKQDGHRFNAYAWDMAKTIESIYSLKDEKIICYEDNIDVDSDDYFKPTNTNFYSLYYRKDESCKNLKEYPEYNFLEKNYIQEPHEFTSSVPSWFVLKPQPRTKSEILHPAKYPEDLVKMFIKIFTKENENVFDPTSGTGSTQLGALMLKRNGYGTELSEFFAKIANKRCKDFVSPDGLLPFDFGVEEIKNDFLILQKDAKLISKDDFPVQHYMITSPPYWDMLNMKGAENQAKRIKSGLKTNYSDDPDDLGNVADYWEFLYFIRDIYFKAASLMVPGSYMTVVVKNIKKKGTNYPYAWDLTNLLQEKLIIMPECFWCQDDISIAPFGYGNTWVSNTFHQYCLNFQVPKNFSL